MIHVHAGPYIPHILGKEELSDEVDHKDLYYNNGTKEAITLAAGGAIKV